MKKSDIDVFEINKLLNIAKVMECTGLSRTTIYALNDPKSPYYDSSFPKKIQITQQRVAWSAKKLNTWIESKIAISEK